MTRQIPSGKHNNPFSAAGKRDRLPSSGEVRAPRVGLAGGRHRSYTAAELLWARTDKTTSPHGCWLVSGVAQHNGYLHIFDAGRQVKAHRLSWELLRGPVPAGLKVLHNCPGGDNPRCVNPDHLFLGTQRDNIHDSIRKGRYNTYGVQKLNAAQVREIRALAARGVLQKDIAKRFNIARNSVSGIVHRKSWDHLDRPLVASGSGADGQPQPLEPTAVDVSGPLYSADSPFDLVPSIDLPVVGEVR